MKLKLIAVGTKMPNWIALGFNEYASRFPREMSLELIEINANKRGKNFDVTKTLDVEGEKILAAAEKGDRIVALEVTGKAYTTQQLSEQIASWQMDGRNVSLLIGGPEGLSAKCSNAAEQKWSLSSLTLPHPLVRVIVAESLYRGWSLLTNHPYHRE